MWRVLAPPILVLVILAGVAWADNSNCREVGVEWIEDYNGHGTNLYWTREEAVGFYQALGEKGWKKQFIWGNDLAWESDFEKRSVGGSDNVFADDVDFVYFAGHGNQLGFYFGTEHDGDGRYKYMVHYSEAEWGDRDLEWAAITGCMVLNKTGSVFDRWGWPVFKGLHVILGFDTVRYDMPIYTSSSWVSPGERFVEYMTDNGANKITTAWVYTTIDWQPSGVRAAYLATCKNENDHLPGYGSVLGDENPPSCLVYGFWEC